MPWNCKCGQRGNKGFICDACMADKEDAEVTQAAPDAQAFVDALADAPTTDFQFVSFEAPATLYSAIGDKDYGTVKKFLLQGVEVDRDSLEEAMRHAPWDTLEPMLRTFRHIDTLSAVGLSLASWAAYVGRLDVLKYLQANGELNRVDRDGKTPLEHALHQEKGDCIAFLDHQSKLVIDARRPQVKEDKGLRWISAEALKSNYELEKQDFDQRMKGKTVVFKASSPGEVFVAGETATAEEFIGLPDSSNFKVKVVNGDISAEVPRVIIKTLEDAMADETHSDDARRIKIEVGKPLGEGKYAVPHHCLKHPAFAKYVEQEKPAEIRYLEDDEFEQSFKEYARKRGSQDEDSAGVTGFNDEGKIAIRARKKGMGSDVHETMHSYGTDTFASAFGFKMNEGATEYFARRVCEAQGIKDREEYDEECQIFETLIQEEVLSAGDLAEMYFGGRADILTTRLEEAADDEFSATAFLKAVQAGNVYPALDYRRKHSKKHATKPSQ